ncbi:hypothetical protein [Streptomyces sp. NPDC008240]|uniref:hypothetical protein n=1 Tax=Streptomyces sp. NPDC008240 TaxID=3364822 RepID=UPI0036EB2A2F
MSPSTASGRRRGRPGRAATGAGGNGTPSSGLSTAGLLTAAVTTIPFDVGTTGGRGKVRITPDPSHVGRTSVQAVVYGPDGGLSTVPEPRLTLTLTGRHVGPLDTHVTDRGGYRSADSFALSHPGTWTVRATIRVSELDQVTVLSAPVRVTR